MTSASTKLLRTQTDDRLAALAAAGHERAFEAIVERYRRPLLRHCRRFLPEARAEDALQQALVSAWSALRRGDDVRELRPWLYRIVHNTALNSLRASGYDYEQLHDALQGTGGPAELAERSAMLRQTLAGLAALPERQREALMRIAVEGRSQEEVAEQLGLSHGAVRQLVHRARTSLRTAATAITPLPLAGWLAAGGDRGDVAARIGELVAGAGGGATLAKAGAVAVIAGSAVGGPAVVHRIDHDRTAAADAAIAAPARAADRSDQRNAAGQAVGTSAAPGPGDAAMLRSGTGDDGPGGTTGGQRRGSGGDDSRSGPGGGGSGDDGSGGDRSGPGPGSDDGTRDDGGGGGSSGAGDDGGSSGPGSGEDSRSGSDDGARSGSDGGGSGTSGGGDDTLDSGSGGDDAALAPASTPSPEPTTSGSGTSGSGTSGSGGDDGLSSGSGSGSGGELDD